IVDRPEQRAPDPAPGPTPAAPPAQPAADPMADSVGRLTSAANANDVAAMNALALLHENGTGVERSRGDAMTWYGRSAATGHGIGMLHLGRLYETAGTSTWQSDSAAYWYRRAAGRGDAEGLRRLAELYR